MSGDGQETGVAAYFVNLLPDISLHTRRSGLKIEKVNDWKVSHLATPLRVCNARFRRPLKKAIGRQPWGCQPLAPPGHLSHDKAHNRSGKIVRERPGQQSAKTKLGHIALSSRRERPKRSDLDPDGPEV